MINQLLNQLGASTKITVGVSVSPGVGLEMIEIDRANKTIIKYACKPLDYDYSKREIADYDRFRETLIDLFDELKISRRSNIVLNLPAVHFGIINLAMNLSDEGVTNVIISEVEQASYIFKRQDPVISWADTLSANSDKENRDIIYAAIQQSALDEINAACIEIGCGLVAIENSYSSLLKALYYNNLADEQMQPNTIWNLMVINQNSYSIITMSGKNIIEFREEPLALRSFVGDEIYNAIISSSQLTLQTIVSNYLYVVSETDLVSAEVLSMKIPFDGHIKFLESNKYVQNNIMEASYNILPNMVLKITPEAIGAGIYQITDFPLKFNLLGQKAPAAVSGIEEAPKIHIGNMEIELTSAFIKKFSILVCSIILIPSLIILFTLNAITQKQQQSLDTLNNEINNCKNELSNYENIDKKDTFDATLEVNSVHSLNRTKLLYYSAIGSNLPPKTWLTYLKISPNGGIDILGRATNVESVYSFYKGLKLSVINSNLRLHKLEMASNSLSNIINSNNSEPSFYEFEITNLSESELKAEEAPAEQQENGQDNSNQQAAPKKGFLPDDFLGLKKNNEQEQRENQPSPPGNLPANLESIEKF